MSREPIETRECSYCNKKIDIYHKKRTEREAVFCSTECTGMFRKKQPNNRCVVCKKPIVVKESALKKIKGTGPCCSRECFYKRQESYYLGEGNPNHKYNKNLDCFYNLTSDGAYILGLIFSDGSINTNGTISISQNCKYKILLKRISDLIFGKNLVTTEKEMSILDIHDKNLVDYIISIGGIKAGKKDKFVCIPNIPEDKKWAFICGYFDGGGSFNYNYRYPEISIYSNSSRILSDIASYWEVSYNGGKAIYASGFKALDICGKMYDSCNLYHPKKKNYYEDILNWEPFPNNGWYSEEFFRCKKLDKNAFLPMKNRVTDIGYDVTALKFVPFNEEAGIYIADMKIAVEPVPGHHFDLVGRSSLPKNNLHFVGGLGIIDRSYTGSIKMYLQKIDINKELPELPFKCGQLVLRKSLHVKIVEVTELSDTERGEDGFGSTGGN